MAVNDGKSLCALACTNKFLNNLLRNPRGPHWRRCAAGIEAPGNVAPRDVVRLTAANGCMHCGKSRIHKVYWPFLLRVCRKPCLESLTISDYRLRTDYKVSADVYRGLPHTFGELYAPRIGSYTLTFYLHAHVDRVLTSLGRLTLAVQDANRDRAERAAREAEERRVAASLAELKTRATAMLGVDVATLGIDHGLQLLARGLARACDATLRTALDQMLNNSMLARCRAVDPAFHHGRLQRLGGAAAVLAMTGEEVVQRVQALAQTIRKEEEARQRAKEEELRTIRERRQQAFDALLARCVALGGGGGCEPCAPHAVDFGGLAHGDGCAAGGSHQPSGAAGAAGAVHCVQALYAEENLPKRVLRKLLQPCQPAPVEKSAPPVLIARS